LETLYFRMGVGCEGCVSTGDHERTGPFDPLDDAHNLVPLAREGIRALVDAGYGNALRPRLWRADSWAGRAIEQRTEAVDAVGERAPDARAGDGEDDGAPPTPGW